MKQTIALIFIIILSLSSEVVFLKTIYTQLEAQPAIDRSVHLSNTSRVGQDQEETLKYDVYTKEPPLFSPFYAPTHLLPLVTKSSNNALIKNKQLIDYQRDKIKEFKQLSISTELNRKANLALEEWVKTPSARLEDYFEAYQISGRDGFGNVKFTGYYTPHVLVSEYQDNIYPVPVYGRVEAASESLDNSQNSYTYPVIAYAQSDKDLRNLKLQGSGLAYLTSGRKRMLYFGGYKTGTKESYFYWSDISAPIGAGSVSLTPRYSVAVDTRYIPLGSCLLALVPIIDKRGKLKHHEFQFLFAQDTGGAIKGTGRIDWYMGSGEAAYREARYMSHYGKVWLLKPIGEK